MGTRHLLSISDLTTAQLKFLVNESVAIAKGRRRGRQPLSGKTVGLYFKKSSTRTRTAFSVAATKLGASTIAYGPTDLQVNTGETLRDTGKVLARYLDALVIRTNERVADMHALATTSNMAIVNAMSECEHPTQAIADLTALEEAFGRLEGLHVLYLGDGNNTLAALALAIAKTPGMRLTMVTPIGYELPADVVVRAHEYANSNQSRIDQQHDSRRLPKVDAVYTARWTTMGVAKADPSWLEQFKPLRVTAELMARVSNEHTLFMHDLPAIRGQEVTDEVLDGPQSIALRQAFHKMTSAMAVLNWCVGGETGCFCDE